MPTWYNKAQADTLLARKAPLASPAFTGSPTVNGSPIGSATPSAPGYDVVLLAGQSNMVGNGGDAANTLIDIADAGIWVFAPSGSNAGVIVQAADPLTHHSGNAATVGPGMEFARWYRTMNPGRRVLLVPAAHNGTAILSGSPRWDATTGWPNDATNLYNLAIAQTQAAITAAGSGAKLAAILWIQGESDSGQSTAAYQTGLEYVIDGFRSRLSSPNVPFILGSMTPAWVAGNGGAPAIDAAHVAVPNRKAFTAFVRGPAGQVTADTLHYTAPAARTIGRGMAAAYLTALANTTPPNAVAANPPAPPTIALASSTAPVVTGTAAVGSVLTTSNGTWAATPDSFAYQWNRAGAAISGATASTYTLVSADTGQAVTCTVTATKAGYTSGTATSNAVTVPAAGGTTITDTFDRADSATSLGTTSDGTKAWAALTGTWGISGNQAYNVSGTSSGLALVDTGAADHTAAVKIAAIGSNPALIFRGTDVNNWMGLWFSSGNLTLLNRVSGSTGTGSLSATVPYAVGDTFKVAVAGTVGTVYRNGVQAATFTAGQTGTRVGLYTDATATRFDDFFASTGSASTAITDTFTRADSTTTLGTTETGGKTWTVIGGPWGIASNQAYNAGGANNAIAVFDIGATDHTVQAKVNVQDSGTMILLRYVDGNNFAGVFASGGTMIPYTKTAGSNGFPGSSTTCLAGDTLKATVVGSTITYYRNGTQVGTFTTALTGTKVGIRADTNAARIDDFLASAP